MKNSLIYMFMIMFVFCVGCGSRIHECKVVGKERRITTRTIENISKSCANTNIYNSTDGIFCYIYISGKATSIFRSSGEKYITGYIRVESPIWDDIIVGDTYPDCVVY